jgi:hypothetical protein
MPLLRTNDRGNQAGHVLCVLYIASVHPSSVCGQAYLYVEGERLTLPESPSRG